MALELSDDRRRDLMDRLQRLFAEEFDEQLTDFRAEEVVKLMLETLGPQVYNQAVADVRDHLQTRLDDLEGEIHIESNV